MANLDPAVKKSWKASLRANDSPWIAFGISSAGGLLAEKLNGMAGLIDWYLHGQVSALLTRGRVAPGEFCLIPSVNGKTSFLMYFYEASPDVKTFLARIRPLNARSLSLAESTFPGDFSSKVKQTLTKEGIRCKKLEPEV
jgi:hypothetical protein